MLHQSHLKKYFAATNNGNEITRIVEPKSKSCSLDMKRSISYLDFLVDVSGSESDEENARPWENEHTMTISDTPEKVKKRQQRKTKTTKKSSILQEEENEDDEETKAYKQRLRNVNTTIRKISISRHIVYLLFSATSQSLQR